MTMSLATFLASMVQDDIPVTIFQPIDNSKNIWDAIVVKHVFHHNTANQEQLMTTAVHMQILRFSL